MPENKPWERSSPQYARRASTRPRRRVLILCEDEKSACFYLKAFPINPLRVDVCTNGTGRNTDSLVDLAIERKREAERAHQPFNEIYCVFDRDDFPAQNFNRAFQLAENHGIRAIWSNEAFELWYLLHFDFLNTTTSRSQYQGMLDRRLGKRYTKNDRTIYECLVSLQPQALKFARGLTKHWINTYGRCDPLRCNPSTNVQDLVLRLNELAELDTIEPL